MMDSEAAIAQARAERDRLRSLVDDIANGRGGGNYGDQEVADMYRRIDALEARIAGAGAGES